jgi:hypothetical protein
MEPPANPRSARYADGRMSSATDSMYNIVFFPSPNLCFFVKRAGYPVDEGQLKAEIIRFILRVRGKVLGFYAVSYSRTMINLGAR